MLVSIVMPVYNAEKFISESIQSVISQTFQNWELIIVDDASTDNSANLAQSFVDSRIRFFQNSINSGVTYSRNLAIKFAKGRFIAFLDSDDIWNNDKLDVQIKFMIINHAQISFTSYHRISENGIRVSTVSVPITVNYRKLLRSNCMGCLTVIYDTYYLGKVYFSDFRKSEDYILWLAILKKGVNANGINLPLASYRVLPKSRSSNKIDVVFCQWSVYRRVEKLNYFISTYLILSYLAIGLNKVIKYRLNSLKSKG